MSASAKGELAHLTGAPGEAGQYLTFQLGSEAYAIGILGIKEIIEYGQVTPVPMMPSSIRGVINLRGAVVPVVDLACRFGGEPSRLSRRSCIVILEVGVDEGVQVIGIVVDAVHEVVQIDAAQIEPPPAFGTRIRTDFIQGMGKIDGRFVVILDIGRVLSVDDLAALADAAAMPAAA